MNNYRGRRRKNKGRIIRNTALTITPLLLATVIAGRWALTSLGDDFHNIFLNERLDDFIITETEEPKEIPKDTPVTTFDVPSIWEVEIPEPVEPKPFERVSSELFDIGYDIPEIDFASLNQINPDVQGWLRIDGTKIDFPLLQGTDNAYYLKHDIENQSNKNGSIFLDYRSNSLDYEMPDLSDVSYIYGHHMKSGAMFASLCNFKDQSFLDEHPFGTIRTESGDIYKLDFFAGMVISGEDDSVLYTGDFADEEEFQAYYDSVKERSMVSSDIDLQLGDKVIALVTCSYETNNSRFVLYARMTKQLEKVIENTDLTENNRRNVVYTLN